jgi:hypothetical protein
MLHIATSNGVMDWHKYPKSRTLIRIRQPETLDSIKCHTFPGLGGKTLDILLHDLTLQFWRVEGFNWDAGPQNQFFCDTGPACACTSPPDLHTSTSTWRLAEALPDCFFSQHHWLWQAICLATGPGPPIRLSGAGPVSLSWQDDVNWTATSQVAGSSSIEPGFEPPHQRLQALLRCRSRL